MARLEEGDPRVEAAAQPDPHTPEQMAPEPTGLWGALGLHVPKRQRTKYEGQAAAERAAVERTLAEVEATVAAVAEEAVQEEGAPEATAVEAAVALPTPILQPAAVVARGHGGRMADVCGDRFSMFAAFARIGGGGGLEGRGAAPGSHEAHGGMMGTDSGAGGGDEATAMKEEAVEKEGASEAKAIEPAAVEEEEEAVEEERAPEVEARTCGALSESITSVHTANLDRMDLDQELLDQVSITL